MPNPSYPQPSPSELPSTADVIIIGGGPAGTAALWAIHRFAPQLKTVLIEKSERLGAGSTLASLENFRTCWTTLCLARQMTRSLEVYLNADEYLGEGAAQAIHVKRRGYLFCAFTPQQAQGFQADVKRLHEIGISHIEYLDADEVRYRYGWVGERVIAAKFDPMAGWLDSNALIYRYVRSAPSAKIVYGVSDVQLRVQAGRIVGVSTPRGDIDAPNIIIAAGASARMIGLTAGINLPVIIRPRQSFTTGWRHTEFPENAPMIIGGVPFPHVRPEAREGAIFGWEYAWRNKQRDPASPHDAMPIPLYPADALKDPRFPSITLALLARQFGHADGVGFADGRYLRGISHNIGYYVYRDGNAAYTLDANGNYQRYDSERAILDAHPDIAGLYLSIAHVGHGIMSSAASGEIIACKVLGLPLPDPSFHDFGLDVPWVEYDENAL